MIFSPSLFGFLPGQPVSQLPCQALEGKKRYALAWLVAYLSSGCSPDAFCLYVTGFPLHTEVQSDASLFGLWQEELAAVTADKTAE